MRVVSYIPSLTETLLWAQVNVVGRTRFCIHPESARHLPVIGGTKTLDAARLAELVPDLVIMDKEENTLEMSQQSPFPIWDMHVMGMASLSFELKRLAQELKNSRLQFLADRAEQICALIEQGRLISQDSLLAVPVGSRETLFPHRKVRYLIWKDPWMQVARETYIGDTLSAFGMQLESSPHQKYPQLNFEDLKKCDHVLLFSSEPYPFASQKMWLERQGLSGYIVDGEVLSWFGVRSLKHLSNGYNLPWIDLSSF